MANHKPDGLLPRHCKALCESIRSFLTCLRKFEHTGNRMELDDERWNRWASRIGKGCAPSAEWEACRFIMSLPYTQPSYTEQTRECETFIFALWVVNHTRFGIQKALESVHPDNVSILNAVETINRLIGE